MKTLKEKTKNDFLRRIYGFMATELNDFGSPELYFKDIDATIKLQEKKLKVLGNIKRCNDQIINLHYNFMLHEDCKEVIKDAKERIEVYTNIKKRLLNYYLKL